MLRKYLFLKTFEILIFFWRVESMRVIWAIVESSGDPKLSSRFYTLLYDKVNQKKINSKSHKSYLTKEWEIHQKYKFS